MGLIQCFKEKGAKILIPPIIEKMWKTNDFKEALFKSDFSF